MNLIIQLAQRGREISSNIINSIFLKKSLAIAFYYELASSNQPAVFPGNFQADIMLFIRAVAMNFNIVEDKM